MCHIFKKIYRVSTYASSNSKKQPKLIKPAQVLSVLLQKLINNCSTITVTVSLLLFHYDCSTMTVPP